MTARARIAGLTLVGLLPFVGTGCIVIADGGWGWSCCNLKVATEPVTERIDLDLGGVDGLDVRTHNGRVSFDAQPAGTGEAFVIATKKGRGRTMAEAKAALDAIEVYVEPAGTGVHRIGWRWKGIKPPYWGATVAFEIQAPGDIHLVAHTHNGPVEVTGVRRGVQLETHNGAIEANEVAGDVHVETHNGPVVVASGGGKLYGRTHNGSVTVDYVGDDVTLITHNGRVVADVSRCGALGGTLTTHNGSVTAVVGDDTSAHLTVRTHHGAISCDVPLSDSRYTKRKLTGTIGAGAGSLKLTTHNGSVRIRKEAG
jgi:hypothetical protein